MFTGIVEEVGRIADVQPGISGFTLSVACNQVQRGARQGDSICVNGACLTVTRLTAGGFFADVSPETARVTTLGRIRRGDAVNLERALAMGDRLGGHMVSGHVDGMGIVRSVRRAGESTEIWYDAPPEVLRYTVSKGSVAVEGVSLTVNALDPTGFSVMLIPHTGAATTLLQKPPGDSVNLEADLIGKYVARLMEGYPAGAGGVTRETLDKL